MVLQSLRANVGQAEAVSLLEGGWGRRWIGRPLRSVAAAYVPFRLYDVEIVNGGKRQRGFFALEAVTGELDLYAFENPPSAADLVEVESRNRLEAALGDEQAMEALKGKLRRLMYQRGFFRVKELEFRANVAAPDLYVPYWIGFYQVGRGVRTRVLDAVRRRFEGGKARALFEGWLSGPG